MTPSEAVQLYQPFRAKVVSLEEYAKWYRDSPSDHFKSSFIANRYQYLYPSSEWSKIWVCIFFRNRQRDLHPDTAGGWRSYNLSFSASQGWTYWYILSKERPTVDDALHHLLTGCIDIWACDTFVDYLKFLKTELQQDLNKLDLDQTEYLYKRAHRMEYILAELIGDAYIEYEQRFDGKSHQLIHMNEFSHFLKTFQEEVEY